MNNIHLAIVAVSTGYAGLIDCSDCRSVPISAGDTSQPDTAVSDTGGPTDAFDPERVIVSRPHFRLVFEDEFRGPTGKPSDDYCFDALDPQCHIWPGGNIVRLSGVIRAREVFLTGR